MKKITETQKAYIAGMIDADGCIFLHRRTDRPHLYVVRVQINNTHKQLLEEMQKECGVGKVVIGRRANKPQWNIIWRLDVVAKGEVMELLTDIIPYLRRKKKQAYLATILLDNNTIPELKEMITIMNHKLNQRGVKHDLSKV